MKTKKTIKAIFILLVLSLTSCANLFEKAFVPDKSLEHYRKDVIQKTDNPKVLYIQNPELETIGAIEDGYLYMGEAYIESEDFNDKGQAIDLAKKIGASLVLIHKKFERTKKVYDNPSPAFPVSKYPVVVDNKTVFTSGYQPTIQYSVEFDSKGKKTKEKVTTNITPGIPILEYQANNKKNNKSKENKVVSTAKALNIWRVPLDQRNYYAVPHGQVAVVLPKENNEKEVEVNSYYASFWAKTNYPPALGVQATDLDDETKQKLQINHGAIIWAVRNDSPASKVPLYRGDILLSLNDEPILNSGVQMGTLIRKNAGKTVKLEIFRNGEVLVKEVKLGRKSF